MPLLGSFTSQIFTAIAKAGGVALVHILNNPNAYGTPDNDWFGRPIAISGNHAIVGAYFEDDAGGIFSGKAYIFNVTTGALLHTLNNPNAYGTSASDGFGTAVAISGNYAIVGASGEDDAGDGSESGKAYIYNVTTGALLHTLNNPNVYSSSANDSFGTAVAISENYAIVGAKGEGANDGTLFSGKAYIFNVTNGTLVHILNNPNAYGGGVILDEFGTSVAISGNYAIVGAALEDDATGTNSGKAYIFNVTTGALVHTLNNPNAYGTSDNDRFGSPVAISGNYAMVGVWMEDDSGGTTSGKVYIYNVTTGALLHTLNNPNAYGTSNNDSFGASVAISGDYAIIGANSEGDAGDAYSGSGIAYIYNVSTGALVHTLNNPNAYGIRADDIFGYSVAIADNYVIIGAPVEDEASGSNSGKAYIYKTDLVSVFGAPMIGTATIASATSVNVPYTAPVGNGGSPITSYTATSSPGGITGTITQAGSGTITVSGLTNNVAYTFTVTATNGVGTSPASVASNSVTPITVASQQLYPGAVDYTRSSAMYSWICPPYVTSVSVVAIGSGGSTGPAYYDPNGTGSGGGGGLGWKNNIAVTPGNSYTVAVGSSNYNSHSFSGEEPGAISYFISPSTVSGGGGGGWNTRTGGGFVGTGGGSGGNGGAWTNGYFDGPYSETSGGGGAGGYAGNGGAGASGSASGSAGNGGGGGGGGGGSYNNVYPYFMGGGGGGGGVGVYGQGASGAGGEIGNVNVPGGVTPRGGGEGSAGYQSYDGGDGGNGVNGTAGPGGDFGGGAGTGWSGAYAGVGAVRIMWQGQSPGTPRSFPSNAADV